MDIAVLLLIFNRPEQTFEVMKCLRRVRPARLYVAADGPRDGNDKDRSRCKEARDIALLVDWPCELKTLLRSSNLGCKRAVSGALNWFFAQEEDGIVLEDDCLPHDDFFRFCVHGLHRFRSDERVYVITGDNFQDGILRGATDESYYFSKFPHCWGWATWRRGWAAYDENLSFWDDDWVNSDAWRRIHPNPIERAHWERLAADFRIGLHDSWAIPWMFSVWYRNGLTMTPDINLVKNIGFGIEATHTTRRHGNQIEVSPVGLGDFHDAKLVVHNEVADWYVFLNHFGGRNLLFPLSVLVKLKILLVRYMRKVQSYGNR